MKRIISAVFGDLFTDGHGLQETLKLELIGDDVTDEYLNQHYKKQINFLGFGLTDIFNNYEESYIQDPEKIERLLPLMRKIDNSNHHCFIMFNFLDDSGFAMEEFSVVTLLEVYLGVKISVVEPSEDLFSVLSINGNVGYGLFHL